MIKKAEVEKLVLDIKKTIKKELRRKNFEAALKLVSTCAMILYETNIYYEDNFLEDVLGVVANEIQMEKYNEYETADSILFFDGFGLNDRGLAQVYLNALCNMKHVIYVTFEDCKNKIPDLVKIINESNSEVYYINRTKENYIRQINQLNSIMLEKKPNKFFFYSVPQDVVATVIMNAYGGVVKRYQINLTDHAFWLGAKCVDWCIEFRDYGAIVSRDFRGIPEEKIVKLPYYPAIHEEREFQGFPFKKQENQCVVFSGGALYKTLGADNKYYELVNNILKANENVIFWYAGSGDDSELKKIITRYPNRAFHTSERSDLFQIIKNSVFLLNTFPVCGGLMYQYAAKAGRVPLTLYRDESTGGILINQSKLNVDFATEELLYEEAQRLIADESYWKKREEEMLMSVVSDGVFLDGLRTIIEEGISPFLIEYKSINTTQFREEYLKRLESRDLNLLIVNKKNAIITMVYFPMRFLKGGYRKFCKKMMRNKKQKCR